MTGEQLDRERSCEEIERLQEQNEQSLLRLDETQQAPEAIRSGAVDSLVIEGPGGPRIFSLESATESYRKLVEGMNEGSATVSDTGTLSTDVEQRGERDRHRSRRSGTRRWRPARSSRTGRPTRWAS